MLTDPPLENRVTPPHPSITQQPAGPGFPTWALNAYASCSLELLVTTGVIATAAQVEVNGAQTPDVVELQTADPVRLHELTQCAVVVLVH